jgi:2-polyprenyl-3-methyl-5-hydroxy-6-metoxy-1,4-benzoquinol methylase
MGQYNQSYFQNTLRAKYSVTPLLRAQVMALPKGARVLELGCGDLQVLKALAPLRPDLKLHGVDVGDVPAEARSDGVHFTRCDIRDFVPDTEYHLALAIDVLEHLPRPDELAVSARKALGADGRFYLSVPSVTKLFLFGDENFFSDYTHVRPFNSKSVARLLSDYGFEVEKVLSGARGGPLVGLRLWYYLARGLLTANTGYLNAAVRLLGGNAIEAVGRKVQ